MSTALKLRRGTTTQHATFTGAAGEITLDTDKNTVVVHDGTTAGGHPLSSASALGTIATQDADSVNIDGGAIDGTTIGANTAAEGTFTTLTATGNVVLGNASTDTLNVGDGGLVKDASGNVGVGTTPSAWQSAMKAVEFAGGMSVFGYNSTNLFMGCNTYNDGTNWRAKTTAGGSLITLTQSGIQFYNIASTSAGSIQSLTTPLLIDGSGNVGIGTSSPAASLSVAKQTTALSGTSNGYGLYMYPTSSGQCWVDALTNSTNNTSLGFRTYNNGTYYTANLDNSGNFQFNSGYGSTATAYGCRAWVNFNGTTNTGGFCTILGSGNVSTVADNGTGAYTVNFSNAMPDANYSQAGSGVGTTNTPANLYITTANLATWKVAGSFRFLHYITSGTAQDASSCSLMFFR